MIVARSSWLTPNRSSICNYRLHFVIRSWSNLYEQSQNFCSITTGTREPIHPLVQFSFFVCIGITLLFFIATVRKLSDVIHLEMCVLQTSRLFILYSTLLYCELITIKHINSSLCCKFADSMYTNAYPSVFTLFRLSHCFSCRGIQT